jgi:molybdenum cofactor biosynthesis protein MoaC
MEQPYATRDVSSKQLTLRTAKAAATLLVAASTVKAIRSGDVPKADPLGVAKVAGIQAAKNASLLIPYCHQVPLDFVKVDIQLRKQEIEISTEVKAIWKTGVEMEALLAASVTALTLYDMLKIIDKEMEIVAVRLLEKKGGKSGMTINGKGLSSAVLVMSDRIHKGKRKDISGKILVRRLKDLRFTVRSYEVVPDERDIIEAKLLDLCDRRGVDLILTTGGTGMSPRDVTPEATMAVISRRMAGVEEAMRAYGQDRIPMSMLSRGVAGVRGETLIINFPGSPGGVTDGMDALFPAILHTFRMMKGGGHPGK